MNITIQPNKLEGKIVVPMSKSYALRMTLCRALAGGDGPECGLRTAAECPAGNAGRCAETAYNCGVPKSVETAVHVGRFNGVADCGDSITVLRMGIAIAGALGVETEFRGTGHLPQRSVQPFLMMLEKHGVKFSSYHLPFRMTGKLQPGDYEFPPDVSSKHVSGLLMALPLLDGDSKIVLGRPASNLAYLQMTVDILEKHGVHIDVLGSTSLAPSFLIPGNQKYTQAPPYCERDWSAAAFWFAANRLGGNIKIEGLEETGRMGDQTVETAMGRIGRSINVNEIPDLAPPIAAAACGYKGTTVLTGCARLRYKDSDRIETIISMINSLGGEAYLEEGDIVIKGKGYLEGGVVDPQHDHRIAMAAVIASCICKDPVEILGADCVSNSYPSFFNDFESLGGRFFTMYDDR